MYSDCIHNKLKLKMISFTIQYLNAQILKVTRHYIKLTEKKL